MNQEAVRRTEILDGARGKYSEERMYTDKNVNALDARVTSMRKNQATHDVGADKLLSRILISINKARYTKEEFIKDLRIAPCLIPRSRKSQEGDGEQMEFHFKRRCF